MFERVRGLIMAAARAVGQPQAVVVDTGGQIYGLLNEIVNGQESQSSLSSQALSLLEQLNSSSGNQNNQIISLLNQIIATQKLQATLANQTSDWATAHADLKTILSSLSAALVDLTTIITNQNTASDNVGAALAVLAVIEGQLTALLSPSKATNIVLALPTITRKGIVVPNYELKNDTVATIPILTTNSAGTVEPMPAGDVFTVVSSNPASLQADMGQTAAGNPAVVLTPLVEASPGLSVQVSDSAGLAVDTQIVDIVDDVTPSNIILDLANATVTSQPVPTNPGP